MTSLPFGYAEFDIVCCHRVLHHVRRPELAVSELARVARSGGKVFIADQLGSVDPLLSLELDRSSVSATRRISDCCPTRTSGASSTRTTSSSCRRKSRGSGSISRSGSSSPASTRRSAFASADPRRPPRTTSRSVGTSPASPARSSLVQGAGGVAVGPTSRARIPGKSALEDRHRPVREPGDGQLLAARATIFAIARATSSGSSTNQRIIPLGGSCAG